MASTSSFSLLYVDMVSGGSSVTVDCTQINYLPEIQCIQAGSIFAANQAALRCDSEWILLMQPGVLPHRNSAQRVATLAARSPAIDVFVPLAVANPSAFATHLKDDLNGLCSSGLLIRKEFLINMAGFNQNCTKFMDVEFLVRCLKKYPQRLKTYLAKTLVKSINSEFAFQAGVERVLQATQLFKAELGYSPSAWFRDYANAVKHHVNSDEGNTISFLMAQDHLAKLASRLDYSVAHSGQPDLGPYLNRSVFEGKAPLGAERVDQLVSEIFPERALACRLPNRFKAFSVGNFCHAAQVLKELALRRQTGPLDWVFTNIQATTHMFENSFEMFLDPGNCETARQEQKVDPHSNVAHNVFYRDQFGVKFMYNHHDLNRQDHLHLFRQGAADLTAALESADPTLLLLVTLHRKDCDNFRPLAENIARRGKNNVLMIVCLDHQESDEEQSALGVQYYSELSTYVAILKTASRSTGMEFSLELDNTRFRRLVHGLALGCFASNQPN